MTQAGKFRTPITLERQSTTQDLNGRPITTWVPLEYATGSPSIAQQYMAEVLDDLPSRQEATQQGLVIGRRRCRVRFRPGDAAVDSSMRVTVHRSTDEVFQIIGGPSYIGQREAVVELYCERSSS